MADSEQSAQERTLEPTAKRLEDARREGQIPRSRELAHLLVLGAGAGVLFLLAAPLMKSGTEIIGRGLTFNATLATDPARMASRLGELTATGVMAIGTKEFQTVSESLWEVRLTHGWLIDAVLDGLELASARLSCRDSAGPVGSIGARCV